MIDHGIAKPVFELLNHQSLKVQIAATEVITNLVLEVSPMRTVSETLISTVFGADSVARKSSKLES